MSEDKEYAGTLSLGKTTDTQDRAGEVTEERPVPELTEENVRAAFDKYRGDFYQMPPMVSAIKQGGVPLYKLARQGKVVERKPRLVHDRALSAVFRNDLQKHKDRIQETPLVQSKH